MPLPDDDVLSHLALDPQDPDAASALRLRDLIWDTIAGAVGRYLGPVISHTATVDLPRPEPLGLMDLPEPDPYLQIPEPGTVTQIELYTSDGWEEEDLEDWEVDGTRIYPVGSWPVGSRARITYDFGWADREPAAAAWLTLSYLERAMSSRETGGASRVALESGSSITYQLQQIPGYEEAMASLRRSAL